MRIDADTCCTPILSSNEFGAKRLSLNNFCLWNIRTVAYVSSISRGVSEIEKLYFKLIVKSSHSRFQCFFNRLIVIGIK